MSEQTESDAIVVAINARFTTPKAYLFGDEDVKSLTTSHILVTVSRRYTEGRLYGGGERLRGGRVTARYVATDADNIYELRARTTTALEDKTLALAGGGEVGPFVFESSEPAGPDDGWVSGDDFWTY